MFENNTDRMFWTIAVLILGATLLMIGNKAFPKAQESIMTTISQNITTSRNSTDSMTANVNPDSKEAQKRDLQLLKDQYTYTYNSDGTINLSEYKGDSKHIVVPKWGPSKNDPSKLTTITTLGTDNTEKFSSKLYSNKGITSVELPNSLKIIGNAVFYNDNLKHVDLPEGLTKIQDAAFEYNNLQTLHLPESLTYIGGQVFTGNQLKTVNFPEKLEVIYGHSFKENPDLKLVYVSKNTDISTKWLGVNVISPFSPYTKVELY